MYVFAEFFGAVIAAALVLPLYGFGQFGSLFDTRVFKTFGLSVPKHLAQVLYFSPDTPHSSAGTSQEPRPLVTGQNASCLFWLMYLLTSEQLSPPCARLGICFCSGTTHMLTHHASCLPDN